MPLWGLRSPTGNIANFLWWLFSLTTPLCWVSLVKITLLRDLTSLEFYVWSYWKTSRLLPHPPLPLWVSVTGTACALFLRLLLDLRLQEQQDPLRFWQPNPTLPPFIGFVLFSPRTLGTICKIRKLRKQRPKETWEMLSKENPFREMKPQQQICQENFNCRLSDGVL